MMVQISLFGEKKNLIARSSDSPLQSVDHNRAAILAADEFQVGKNFEKYPQLKFSVHHETFLRPKTQNSRAEELLQ